MRFILKIAIFLICMPLFLCINACSDSDNTEETEDTSQNPSGSPMTFRVYPQSDAGENPLIHLTAEYGDWHISEFQSPGEYNRKTWLFVNGKLDISQLVTVEQGMICFQDYDLNNGAAGDEAFYFISDNKTGLTAYRCQTNNNGNNIQILDILPLSVSEASPSKSARSQEDGMDDIRAILDRHLTELSEQIDDFGTFLPAKLGSICSVWTQLAIPMARMTLYSNDPSKLEELRMEYTLNTAEGQAMDVFVNVVIPTYEEILENIKKAYIMAKYGLGLTDWDEDEYYDWLQSLKNSKVEKDVEEISVFSSSRRPKILSSLTEVGTYTIKTNIYNIGLTDAWGSMEIYQNGGGSYISECGIRLTDPLRHETFIRNDKFDGKIHITGLSQNTTYRATAYIKSYGVTHYGNTIKFKTDAEFSVTPESITFGPGKGSRLVAVNLPDESWTWAIADKPSWCKITKSASSFFVDVDASSVARKGEITVTGKSKQSNSEKSCTISVVQTAGYYFSGKIKVDVKDDDGGNSIQEIDFSTFVQQTNNTYLLSYTGPATTVMFINQDISKQPTAGDTDTKITSYSYNITPTGFTLAGNIGGNAGGNRISGYFKVTVDLSNGTFQLDDKKRLSDSDYWVDAHCSGTLHLADLPQ